MISMLNGVASAIDQILNTIWPPLRPYYPKTKEHKGEEKKQTNETLNKYLTIIDLKQYLESGKPEVIFVLQNYCNSDGLLSDLDAFFLNSFRSNESIKVKIQLFANSLGFKA